jgi:acetyl/propionyl-CoA carboxylase alpha subunit/acetyl-CoA carboxylase carboxyltransferase component
MPLTSLLIANRGEIAVRIARAAAERGIRTVSVYSEDDATSLHVRRSDASVALKGRGVSAYLDTKQILDAAEASGCDAIHPGYGFLSENAAFAQECEERGIVFVGPTAAVLNLFGDKVQARAYAMSCDVPLAKGTNGATDLKDIEAFYKSLGPDAKVMIKAVAGGGGRGMRAVSSFDDLAVAYERCQSEARAAFGIADVYVEEIVQDARHVEVQIIGDGTGAVSHLYERECSLQRRHQKLIEIAPCPGLDARTREAMVRAATAMASKVKYRGVGTFEFLVRALQSDGAQFVFMEANPRIQVEHTVTEEVLGLDLVNAQLDIAGGASLAELGLSQRDIPEPRGYAIQARINMERIQPDGTALPASGSLTAFEPSSGPGVRVDTYGYTGYVTSPSFDSLIAKVIVHTPRGSLENAVRRARRAVQEFRIEGVETNIAFLLAILDRDEVGRQQFTTRFVENHLQELASIAVNVSEASPLAETISEDGLHTISSTMHGMLVSFDVKEGDIVAAGQQVAVIEAMKMEIVVSTSCAGIVERLLSSPQSSVQTGQPLLTLRPSDGQETSISDRPRIDLDAIRPDLQELFDRRAKLADEARPDAVGKRHARGQRTARENIADLFDPDSFVEYGALSIPAQRGRRSVDDLIASYPADGMIAGIGSVNGSLFPAEQTRCMVLAYDYTVLAGTQGIMAHRKKDRMLQLAEQWRLPVITFAEGGGGRPGDTDHLGVSGLESMTFRRFAALSGVVPLVGIAAGRCFAGNAALLGCCDVIIATQDATIGMAGPAMIEGGGLGTFTPEQVGPVSVQAPNGVVDIVVENEEEAVATAKRYLSYFQGARSDWKCEDQRQLRHAIPENRLRTHDVHAVIHGMCDTDSVLELRSAFSPAMVTALARIEGRPVGIIANNSIHMAGAIDANCADKAARFMQLCNAFGLPIVSLCDTPGFMVGPEAEKTGVVRHVSRMFVVSAGMQVPILTVVLRKAYGLGAMAMAAGSTHAPLATIAWPTAEFGGMGLEGAVRLAYRSELKAVQDPAARKALFEEKVQTLYQHGKALNVATYLEVDDVIDPAETRNWITRSLQVAQAAPKDRTGRPRFVDTW